MEIQLFLFHSIIASTFPTYTYQGALYVFFFHVVLPRTISSYLSPAFSCRRCVYFIGLCWSAPAKLWWPLMISGESEGPMAMVTFSCGGIESSSGWQMDCTTSELPHSFLYSRVMLLSWFCCRKWSGSVCIAQRRYAIRDIIVLALVVLPYSLSLSLWVNLRPYL